MSVHRVLGGLTWLGAVLGLALVPALSRAQDTAAPKSRPAPSDSTTAQEPPCPSETTAPEDPDRLRISKPIACRSIDGYERYETLPEGKITAEEKLQVYYRVLACKSVLKEKEYLVHLVQDGQIRRKGEKSVLRSKKKILDYESRSPERLDWIFLRNSVPLKGLKPGEYEYDIILRDENAPGPPVVQTLPFQVIPPELPGAQPAGEAGP